MPIAVSNRFRTPCGTLISIEKIYGTDNRDIYKGSTAFKPPEIARRIERGKLAVIKSISRTPLVARKVIHLGDALHALAAGGLALLFAPTVPYGLELVGMQRQLATEGEASVGVITLRLRPDVVFEHPAVVHLVDVVAAQDQRRVHQPQQHAGGHRHGA